MTVLWRWLRTRRGLMITLPIALVLAATAVVVPVVLSDKCHYFGTGCRTPGIHVPRLPRPLTPLQAATRGEYVALGDSYSSGEGAWNLAADRAFVNGGAADCHRSGRSYFQTVLESHRFADSGEFWACSGATIPDVLTSGQRGEPAQVTRVKGDASLVTLSIGGNDIGFSEIVTKCVVKLPWSSACHDQDPAIRARLAQLPGGLANVIGQITRRAPKARVMLLGYPRPFPLRPQHSVSNIGVADQMYLNGVVHDLDNAIYLAARAADRRIAAAHGAGSVEFVDGYPAFNGHELGTPQSYLNGLDIDLGDLSAARRSFHPNALGYQRFGQLMNQQIQAGPGRQIYQYR